MQRQYLSIDIGGTEIKSALIDHSGNIFEKNHVPTPHQKEAFLAAIFAVVEPVLDKVTAICVSLPGVAGDIKQPAFGNQSVEDREHHFFLVFFVCQRHRRTQWQCSTPQNTPVL